jgi:NADPH2:quinone reductase
MKMKAIALTGHEGFNSMRMIETDRPKPGPDEVLIQVKAAGINFAELELTKGRYHIPKELPFVMGFEAAGTVVEMGSEVRDFRIGDKVTSLVSSGGYAEYATAGARFAIPIPAGISFAEAVTIPVQGLSAYALMKFAARLQPAESLLIQAAAGGVGLYLLQLAKLMGAGNVIGLASSKQKLDLIAGLGADFAINYNDSDWTEQVKRATAGKGVDVALEAASGEVGEASFRLLAPFGRIVIFGARNIHDTLSPEKVRQLIYQNQSVVGFNFPSLRAEQIAECVPDLLRWIADGKLRLFANTAYPLAEVRTAFEALASRQTIGKVVLTP